MKQFKKWMFAAIILCGTATMLTSCLFEDNPSTPSRPIPEGADSKDYQPSDVSVALLGSLSSYADEEVINYWFTNVEHHVSYKTMVVITNEINETNKEDIAKVLGRYGLLLVVDPTEENVKKYAEELGIDPDADYSKLELIALSGFGDQFLSYGEESTSDDVAPTYIASDEIWDTAPQEFMGMYRFAQWLDTVEAKFKEYEDYYAALNADDDDEDDVATTRGGNEVSTMLHLANMPKIYRSINLNYTRKGYQSYKNALYDEDYEDCVYSASCDYRLIPMYKYPVSSADPGGDYYIVETTASWNCQSTLKKWHQNKHSTTNRDSWNFFPHKCHLYSKAIPTKSEYEITVLPGEGALFPENPDHDTDVEDKRSFSLEGNVSAGGSGSVDPTGFSAEGNIDASLGFGAEWSKDQFYKVSHININQYKDNGGVGHTISVPEDYRPVKESSHNPTIYSPKGVNYSTSLNVPESWIWKVTGTKMDTADSPFELEFHAEPEVGWYSYFIAGSSLDCRAYDDVKMSAKISIPAPFRMNIGYIKLINNGDKDGNQLDLLKVKCVHSDTKRVAFMMQNNVVDSGKDVILALPANKEYDIEIWMGKTWNEKKKYVLNGWEAASYGKVDAVKTSLFSPAN
jgi:hypothetical protein